MREFHTTCKSDTYVVQNTPHISYEDKPYLQVNNDPGTIHVALMHFALPLHFRHYFVIEATLIFYKKAGSGWTGRTVEAKRLTESWNEDVDWNHRPAHTELHAADASAGDSNPVEVDVTDILQDVVAGASWHGLQLTVNGGDGSHKLHSSEGPFGLRPRLRIKYTARPDAVTHLSPNGIALYDPTPVVRWHPVYKPHHDSQAQSQVQFAPPTLSGTPDWASADYDSGWQDNDVGAWDTGDPPSGPVYSGIPDGEMRFWRVRIRDSFGNISDYSEAAEVSYESPGTVEIISPAADGDGVQDTTPVIDWTFTPGGNGVEQSALKVISYVHRPSGFVQLDDTGWVHKTDTDFTLPRGVIRHTDTVPLVQGREYMVKVYVLDGGRDDFGFERNLNDRQTPHDTRKFVFRNGVRFEGTLETPDGSEPEETGTMLTVPGIPAGADLTYAVDQTPDPNVRLVEREVDSGKIYFRHGKNILTKNESDVETDLTGFSVGTNCSLAQSSAEALDGDNSLEVTASADGDMTFRVADAADGAPVVAGNTYTASAFGLSTTANREYIVGIVFFDSSNAQIGSVHDGDPATDQDAWPRIPASSTFTAPVGAVKAGIRVKVLNADAGEVHYFDDFQIEWDDEATDWIYGDSVNVGDTAVIVYNEIESPSNLAANIPNSVVPLVHFTWERSSTPDQFGIIVDDELLAHIDGADADDGDGNYSWSWMGMRPHVQHTVTVRARTYGIGWSADSNEVRVEYKPTGIQLIAPDAGIWVSIYDQEHIQETLSRDGNTFYLVGRRDPVRIDGKARGMYGSVKGVLMQDSFGSAHDHLLDLFEIFGLHATNSHLRLVFGRQAYHVIVANLVHDQWPDVGRSTVYNVSFDWWQTGGFQVPTKGHA